MMTWNAAEEPDPVRIGPLGWLRAVLRGAALSGLAYGSLGVLLAVRLIEAPLYGAQRPWTPRITRFVCRGSLAILGIRYKVVGEPMRHRGAVVANHSSWLDIFALNACQQIYFVSKSEVARWAGIGWLARATGTAFISRDPKKARIQKDMLEQRIRAGHQLLFFPEGTSTDGQRVLPFKSTLFAAFYGHGLEHVMQIQPVSVIYTAPQGYDKRFYGWWGEMPFGRHFLQTLAAARRGDVEVKFHDPISVDEFTSRKALAAQCEAEIKKAVKAVLGDGYQG